jgi:Bacterial type II and III secretion system protein
MRRILPISLLFLIAFALPVELTAQDTIKPDQSVKAAETAPQFFHLVFDVQELDNADKPINSRTYSTSVSTDRVFQGSIRTGSQIPVPIGSQEAADKGPVVDTQYRYVDSGINFDISHVKVDGNQVSLEISADINSIADTHDPRLNQPIMRQNRWRAAVLIPIGKPTVVFRSDLLDNKGAIEVLLTATPVSQR